MGFKSTAATALQIAGLLLIGHFVMSPIMAYLKPYTPHEAALTVFAASLIGLVLYTGWRCVVEFQRGIMAGRETAASTATPSRHFTVRRLFSVLFGVSYFVLVSWFLSAALQTRLWPMLILVSCGVAALMAIISTFARKFARGNRQAGQVSLPDIAMLFTAVAIYLWPIAAIVRASDDDAVASPLQWLVITAIALTFFAITTVVLAFLTDAMGWMIGRASKCLQFRHRPPGQRRA
jgi:hypothetical protein